MRSSQLFLLDLLTAILTPLDLSNAKVSLDGYQDALRLVQHSSFEVSNAIEQQKVNAWKSSGLDDTFVPLVHDRARGGVGCGCR